MSAILVILLCTTLYFPGLILAFIEGFNFYESLGLAMLGGFIGFWIYGYMGELIKSIWLKARKDQRKRRTFTRYNRFLVKVRSGYGLAGIAFITPIVKNPLGFAIGMTLAKRRMTVFIYMMISMLFWGLLTCGLYFGLDIDITEVF